MKNTMKITAIAALFLISLTSMAPVPSNHLVISKEGKSFFFSMKSQLNGSTIKITDNSANTIFYTDVYDGSYAKKFNLEQLAEGTYYFTVDNPQASVVYTLDLNDNKVEIIKKEEKASPSNFRIEGDKVFFALSNDDLKMVKIKITNSKNAEVFYESERVEGSIDKVFNFETAEKDSYTISIEDGKNTYYQHIEIV